MCGATMDVRFVPKADIHAASMGAADDGGAHFVRSSYLAPVLARSWATVTGGGFHTPVSASDFGA